MEILEDRTYLSGTDNLESRYVMSDVALELGIPYVYGAVFQLVGQAALLCAPGAPCYRCLFPAPPNPESVRPAAETGILGVVPGTIGLVQAAEALRWITRYAEWAESRLLIYDARRVEFLSIPLSPDPSCAFCSGRAAS